MRADVLFILVVCVWNLCSVSAEDEIYEESAKDLSRGYGKDIDWMTLEAGLKEAKEKSKPIFLLIHKTWCGACRNLKPYLRDSMGFNSLSKAFVMVNVEDDEEPNDEKYKPDGGYIPRILFMNHFGEVQKNIINENGNPKYKYFYTDEKSVIKSMELAISLLRIEDFDNNYQKIKDQHGDDDFFDDLDDYMEFHEEL